MDNGQHILIVDDDAAVRRFLRASLTTQGYLVNEVSSGEEALQLAPTYRPDVIILDLRLPGAGGREVTSCLRVWSRIAIIILSVLSDEASKIDALDAGADDYLTKPFGPGELLARIRAVLRRTNAQDNGPVFTTGDLTVDRAKSLVRIREREIQLTPTEYSLLKAMISRVNCLLTHRQLAREVWGGVQYADASHLLRVNICNLRRKLGEDPSKPRYIITEAGAGYRFRSEYCAIVGIDYLAQERRHRRRLLTGLRRYLASSVSPTVAEGRPIE